MDTVQLYVGDYGHTVRVRTYLPDIGDATALTLKFKKIGATTTATITSGSVVAGDTTYYAVDFTVASGWTTTRAGEWVGQIEATFANGLVASDDPFRLRIVAKPTT